MKNRRVCTANKQIGWKRLDWGAGGRKKTSEIVKTNFHQIAFEPSENASHGDEQEIGNKFKKAAWSTLAADAVGVMLYTGK